MLKIIDIKTEKVLEKISDRYKSGSRKIWTRERIIECLKNLPKDKPITKRSLLNYRKEKIEICHPCVLASEFGSIKNACDEAGIRCDCLYGKEHQRHMAQSNIKYTKEDVIKGLKLISKKYGKFRPMELNKLLKKEGLFCKDIVVKYFGGVRKALKELNIYHRNHYWSNKRIINTLLELNKKHGKFKKTDINLIFRKEDELCGAKLIRDRFGSLEKAAEYAGITFEQHTSMVPNIGRNETEILDSIEIENNITINRQYQVWPYHLDGYDSVNNIAYEIDELHHSSTENKIRDFLREQSIKQRLGCEFVRIKDYNN